MNLYLISANTRGYDVFSDAVVVASSSLQARKIHPSGRQEDWDDEWRTSWAASFADVTARRIGVAEADLKEGDVICASFHAG